MSKNENITKNKYLKIILLVLCAAIGVFLLIGGDIFGGDSDDGDADTNSPCVPDANEYASSVEERIEKLCSGVKGAGNVSAMVTLSGGYNAVYAQNSQSASSGYKNEFVVVGGGSNEEALLIGYTNPTIAGIGIVCSGGGDESVRCEIISLISAAFGISPNKIYVTRSQN